MHTRAAPPWLLAAALACIVALGTTGALAQGPLVLERVEVLPGGGAEEGSVRALLPLRPGQQVDAAVLSAAREALRGSGSFRAVEVSTARGSRPGHVVLRVEAELDRAARLQTGFGHEPLDGWYLNLVGARWNAPFGQPGQLRLGLRAGLRSGGVLAEYERTALGGAAVDLLLRGSAGSRTWIAFAGDDEYRQKLSQSRTEAGLRWRAADGLRAALFAGVERVDPEQTLDELHGDAEIGAGTLVPSIAGDITLLRARLELALDRRDAPAYPRDGLWLGTRLGGGLVDQSAAFGRGDFVGLAWMPLPGRGALALQAGASWVGPGAPYFERVVFGGVGSVRGFRDASLSGPQGARATWQTAVEWRQPLVGASAPVPRVTGVLFADLGQGWDAQGVRGDPAVGAGYGLRLRIPWIQVFGLDVGFPLTDPATRDPFWLHGSLGFSF